MRDVPLWTSRTKVALRRNSRGVETSQDNSSRVLKGFKGKLRMKGLEGHKDFTKVGTQRPH